MPSCKFIRCRRTNSLAKVSGVACSYTTAEFVPLQSYVNFCMPQFINSALNPFNAVGFKCQIGFQCSCLVCLTWNLMQKYDLAGGDLSASPVPIHPRIALNDVWTSASGEALSCLRVCNKIIWQGSIMKLFVVVTGNLNLPKTTEVEGCMVCCFF